MSQEVLVMTFLASILLPFFLWYRHYDYNWLKQFNGSYFTLPILGDALQFVGNTSNVGSKLHSNFKRYGPTYKFWILNKPTLFTADINLVKKLLSSRRHLEKHFTYEYSIKLFFGKYGLGTSDGHQWKNDRWILNKIFNYKYLESSFKFSLANSIVLRENLHHETKDVKCIYLFRNHFLSTILMSFGVDANWITKERLDSWLEYFDGALEIVNKRISHPWTRNSLFWKLSGHKARYEKFENLAKCAVKDILAHLETRHSNMRNSDSIKVSGTSRFSNGTRNKDVKNVIDKNSLARFLYIKGTYTTAITCTMTLFYLALNAECQRKAHEEVDSFFDTTQELKFSDISKLKYLRMCVQEAMRLYPPVAIIGRTVGNDIFLDERKIPKGASIIVSIHEMNLNQIYFPDPLKYDPERFNEFNSKARPQGSYIPFSSGPRNCIGMKYAESVLVPALAMTLRKFSIHTNQKAENIRVMYEVAGKPYPQVEIMFKQRQISVK